MPACDGAPGCPNPTVVQWQRRLTPAEADAYLEQQETLRAWAIREAPDGSALGPAPVRGDATRAVYACASHAIDLELASRVHGADCTAPQPDHLPGCDCQPEPHPEPEPEPAVTLPIGWTVPTP